MNHQRSRYLQLLAVAVCYAASQSGALACATCFGQTDSPLGRGLNWGIFALLVVVASVLAGICSFFVFIARRAAQVESEQVVGSAPQVDQSQSSLSKTV